MDLSEFVRIAAFLALASAARAGDTAMFADGNFGAGWTSTKIVDTTSGASASFTSTTIPTGGGPGPYRETSHTFNAGTIVVAHTNPLYVYDPSSTPICSIDFSWYLVHFTASSVGGAVSYRLGLLQNGSWYGGPNIDVTDPLWAGYPESDLHASHFTLVTGAGPSTPDFSCAGGLIQFGFLTANSSSSASFVTTMSGCDEWSVTLHLEQTTLLDGTFPPGWLSVIALDTAGTHFVAWGTFGTGGNPGERRQVYQTGGDGEVVATNLSTLVHDPSVEPIYAIDWSYDLANVSGPGGGSQAGYHLGLYQGVTHYRSVDADFNPNTTWVAYSHFDVPSTGFVRVAGPGPMHPDFTASGGPIRFGYETRTVLAASTFTEWYSSMDNWSVRVKLAPPCAPAVGSAYCFGDQPLAPCPCFPSVPAGAAGRGCPNSVEPRGALIEAHGVASISADTLVLMASGMPNSSCLYYQGTAPASTAFGDGRRCTAGTVIRLGTKVNACGASQYPSALDPRISIKGAVTTPGVRHYQAWYRNAAAFCTTSTFNLTNGLSVAWGT